MMYDVHDDGLRRVRVLYTEDYRELTTSLISCLVCTQPYKRTCKGHAERQSPSYTEWQDTGKTFVMFVVSREIIKD